MCEIALQHHLPNFVECWWDHLIVDILLCNAIGILLGMILIRWLGLKEYAWIDWDYKQGIRLPSALRLFAGIIFPALLCDLNIFYLKYLLWVPSSHYVCLIRLAIIWLLGCGAVRERYDYYVDYTISRLGPFNRIMSALLFLEFCLVVKFSQGEFQKPWPENVVNCYGFIIKFLTLWLLVRWLTNYRLTGMLGKVWNYPIALWLLYAGLVLPQVMLFFCEQVDIGGGIPMRHAFDTGLEAIRSMIEGSNSDH